MDAFRKCWQCVVLLVVLAIYSYFAGMVLEVLAKSSLYSAHKYLGGRFLALGTNWLYHLKAESGSPFFWLCFYPTLACAAYLWHLMRKTVDATECRTKFALVALASFIAVSGFTLLCISLLAVPFLPFDGGLHLGDPPPLTPAQHFIFWGLVILGLLNAFLFLRMCWSRSRDSARAS